MWERSLNKIPELNLPLLTMIEREWIAYSWIPVVTYSEYCFNQFKMFATDAKFEESD